jgi:hypothetical protein
MASALVSCLSSKKDDAVKLELQKLEKMTESIISLLTPRVKSADNIIRNSKSLISYFKRY